jgi:hypothetical protein
MENLLGIEMTLLVFGIFIICYIVFNTIATILSILNIIKNNGNWNWNVIQHAILLTIGILLIIIAFSV